MKMRKVLLNKYSMKKKRLKLTIHRNNNRK